MRDGLYIVMTRDITAAFVVREGEVTTCAPILRKNLEHWKKVAQWHPSDLSIPPVEMEMAK
jgi:hypothetical protein